LRAEIRRAASSRTTVAGLGPTLPADAFFIGAWVVSGLLFRQASVESAPAA